MSQKIKKLLRVGDVVYSANGGKPMQVKKIDALGFETESDFFRYDEVRILYFLTEVGYKCRNKEVNL